MNQVLICGAAGFTNLGDDCILWGILSQLRETASEPTARVAGGPALAPLVQPFGAAAIPYEDRFELARAIEEADLVILGGGGLMYDIEYDASLVRLLTEPPDRQWLYEMAKITSAAGAAGKPVMLYGVGAGPLLTEAGRNVARFICEQAQAVTVRDRASADVLMASGVPATRVHVAADPALSVEAGSVEAAQAFLAESGVADSPRPWVAVNLRPWYRHGRKAEGGEDEMDRLVEGAGALVRGICDELGGTALLLPFQRLYDDDLEVLRGARRAAGDPDRAVLLEPALSPPDFVAFLAQCDLLVGMRMHSLLLAMNANLPFVGLPYSPKVVEFAGAAGLSDYLHPVDTLDPAAALATCRQALEKRERIRAIMTERRRELTQLARVPAELAAALLERKAAPARESAPRTPSGRSAKGLRVLMWIRPDYREVPGGDVVQLEAMFPYLSEAGVECTLTGEEEPDLDGCDLIHTINLDRPEDPYRHCLAALAAGKPIVVSTVHADLSELLQWGDPDYWDLPDPAVGLPRPQPAPPSYPAELHARARGHLQRQAIIDWATVYLPNAQMNAEELQATFGLDLSRTVVVPNATRESFFDASPELFVNRHGLRDFVLCVGRVEAKKNQLSLIAALRGSGLPLVIVGRPNPESYMDLCRKYADENVRFLPGLSEEELASAYAAAKVHVLASWIELPGLTTLEAAAAGCNIVSTDRGSPREYLGDMAWYCDPRSTASIREAVLAAYEAPRSERLREHVRENYTWRRAAEQTVAGYLLALDLHQAKSEADRRAAAVEATRRHADWMARLAADRADEAQRAVQWGREVERHAKHLEERVRDMEALSQELDDLRAEFERVTSRRLYRWSERVARAGGGILRRLRIAR